MGRGAVGKLRGRTVILWGHGWKRPESGWKRRTRLAFYRLVDGLLVYGERAEELGVEYGVPSRKIHVVFNSLYPQAALSARSEPPPSEAPTVIYSSRLTPRHRLDPLRRPWPHGLRGSRGLA